MTLSLHSTDIHFCGIRIWFEYEGVAPHLGEDLRMARESLAHMAENACMMLPGLKTPRVKGYQDRIAALEQDLARANREWHAWQELAKKAKAANVVLEQRLANASAFAVQEKVNADAMERERDQAQAFAKEAQAPPVLTELLDILQAVVGDHGAGEGAADCARRIIKERNQWKAAAQNSMEKLMRIEEAMA